MPGRELVVPFIAASAGEVNDAAIVKLVVCDRPSVVMARHLDVDVFIP